MQRKVRLSISLNNCCWLCWLGPNIDRWRRYVIALKQRLRLFSIFNTYTNQHRTLVRLPMLNLRKFWECAHSEGNPSSAFPSLPFPLLSLLFLPLPFYPSSPFLCPPLFSSLPLEVVPSKIQLWDLGERCELPQQGLGPIPSRNRIWCKKDDIWWQQF